MGLHHLTVVGRCSRGSTRVDGNELDAGFACPLESFV
jgi:hypothetical protein